MGASFVGKHLVPRLAQFWNKQYLDLVHGLAFAHQVMNPNLFFFNQSTPLADLIYHGLLSSHPITNLAKWVPTLMHSLGYCSSPEGDAGDPSDSPMLLDVSSASRKMGNSTENEVWTLPWLLSTSMATPVPVDIRSWELKNCLGYYRSMNFWSCSVGLLSTNPRNNSLKETGTLKFSWSWAFMWATFNFYKFMLASFPVKKLQT